jgi:hypothetical protein
MTGFIALFDTACDYTSQFSITHSNVQSDALGALFGSNFQRLLWKHACLRSRYLAMAVV